MAKESPTLAPRCRVSQNLGVLRQADTWWFCLFYAVTFGGYVGLSSFLPLFLRDHFGVTPVAAGSLTAVAALMGSGARPLGGYLADKIGGARLLRILLLGIGATYASAASLPRLESWRSCSSPAWRASEWGTARCFSSCRSGSARRSGSRPA